MTSVPVSVLPGLTGLRVDSIQTTDTAIVITAAVAATHAVCPDCGYPSSRIHSTYVRHPHDLPWNGRPVQFTLHVRRFFCATPTCERTTFVEQVTDLTRPAAQRTIGLNTALLTLGLALGGEAGASLGTQLGFRASADTILRRIRAVTPAPIPPPRVVGLDDWAIRKGQRYGSIIVDLERHRPIALLPEHAAAPIITWFQHHPSVEIITRDRASIYTEALAQGAPTALQVADRWHLTHNLGTALQDFLARHTGALHAVAHQLTAERMPPEPVPAPPAQLPPLAPPGHIVGPVALRQYQFAEAKRLRTAGWSYRRIAQALHLNRRTVLRYVQADQLPRRVLPQTTSSVTPYLTYLRARWAAGCQHGPPLLAELQAQGYRGSLSSIYRALKGLRSAAGRRGASDAAIVQVTPRSPRQAMWLLLREQHTPAAEDAAYRSALCRYDPLIAHAAALGQRFLAMVRDRHADGLDQWLVDAETCGIKELRGLAQSLRRDYAAVQMALTSSWSNGQTEGQVNRLKLIKRTMYGRASFDVLRNRVLAAP